MKTPKTYTAALLLGLACVAQQAQAQFIKIDDFASAHQGTLSGQISDGPSNFVWQSVGTAATIIISNNVTTPGVGLPGSGTPLTTNVAVTTIADGAAYIQLPQAIPTSSTVATLFMQFDMGPSQAANNINWDFAGATGSDGGGAQNQIELNANVPNRAGVCIRNNGSFVWFSADGQNIFVPTNSTVYNVWFVVNNSAKNFVMYMQDANPSGTDLPTLTKMWVATTGAAASFPATPPTFTTNAIAFRNQSAATMTLFAFGPGGGNNTNQYTYSLYEDPHSLDLTNPVTGAAPILLGPPVITLQPLPEELYAGGTITFTVGATGGGLHYQWLTNGVPVNDGGNIVGSATSTLTISNVSAANALNYSCVITNANVIGYQSTNSAAAGMTFVTPNGAFETRQAAAGPIHFYAFDDTGSPSSGTETAFDYAGGDNGIYGIYCLNGFNGVAGPRPTDGFPGFSAANYAVLNNEQNTYVTVASPWNLNTNTVTISAWIYPEEAENNLAGIVFNRGSGNDVGGLNFSTSGNSTLGYTWNNDANTTNWDSGLQPPINQWSYVALVVTPTNATIYMMNTGGLLSSVHNYPHATEAFGGTTTIGIDSGTLNGLRSFNGSIDEVAVFNQALTPGQVQGIFTNASGIAAYGPTNAVTVVTPAPSTDIYPGQTAQFASFNGGTLPLYYEWQLNGVNLADGANAVGVIIGSATPSLVISNLAVGDAGNSYNLTLVTSNSTGVFTSSVPAVLFVSTTTPNQTIYTLGFEASGTDWNTGTNWDDGNPASLSAYSEPQSTYQVVPGTLERTPALTNASFPGSVLVLEGNGVLLDGNSAAFATNTTTGELRLKQSGTASVTNFQNAYTYGGSVYFPDLQLNGGQLDNGTSSGVTVNGRIDVLTNSAIYADSGANGAVRAIQINSYLTGAGTITYGYLSNSNYTNNDLIISGSTNKFSGQWNILQGTLLGNATNSLGTNSITIGTNAALEVTYNLNNPKANLFLNGQMFLYTSNTFNAVEVNGGSLPVGTYTFAQLASAYPASFPAVWPVQVGSTTGTNTGTGSITVLATLLPQITQQPAPASLSLYPGQTAQFTALVARATSYQWWFTNLSNVGTKLNDGGSFSGTKTNVLTIANVGSGNAGTYTLVAANLAGSVASSNAALSISAPSGPIFNITMSVAETTPQDWNSGTNWSDQNPASLSAYSEPGSTYEILPGAVLLTPDLATNTTFPGDDLIIDNGGGLVLEHLGSQGVAIQNLQLNGVLDNGANGLATLTGKLAVTNSATIYTDTNPPPALIVNFDAPGGVGGANYAGMGAYVDQPGNTYWNPVTGTSGTTAAATNSDGVTISTVTFTENSGSFGVGVNYGSYNNSAGTPANTPPALEDNYLWVANNFIPNFVQEFITSSLNGVPPGTYNLYLYGNNGGNSTGFNGTGKQNDWGTSFTVSSDVTPASILSTTNNQVTYTTDSFIQGVDYVVFSNVVVGVGGTITIAWTANTNITSFAGANAYAALNGLQLVEVGAGAPGPRPFEVSSMLTGSGTITYDAGDTNFESDLDIANAGNTFTGQWNVMEGALFGGVAGSLGTNTITISTNGALETAYNINNPNAGLVLYGKVFLHASDTFKTLTVNGTVVNAGTYSFAQLNGMFPANFPAVWPLQTNSLVSAGSGQITVLSPVAVYVPTTLVVGHSGSNLTLSWSNGGNLETTTNLAGTWIPVAGATSPYTVTPTNSPAQFYRVHP